MVPPAIADLDLNRRIVRGVPAWPNAAGAEPWSRFEFGVRRRSTRQVILRWRLPRNRFTELAMPVLREMGVDQIMRRTGRKKSAVYEVLSDNLKTRGAPAARYRDAAIEYVTERLADNAETPIPKHPYAALYLHAKEGSRGADVAGQHKRRNVEAAYSEAVRRTRTVGVARDSPNIALWRFR